MTRTDVKKAVENLNKSYMQRSNNMFKVDIAYGGVCIVLSGKRKKVGNTYRFLGIGSGQSKLTSAYKSANETLAELGMILSDKDVIKRFIARHTKR